MTKTYNTKKRVFASDAINMEDISFEYLNIINIPPGGGKTTWALKELPKYASKKSKILYLIDRRTSKNTTQKSKNISDKLSLFKSSGRIEMLNLATPTTPWGLSVSDISLKTLSLVETILYLFFIDS